MKGLFALALMRLTLLGRQPEIVFWAFVFPVMLSMVLGLAFRSQTASTSRVALLDGPPARDVRAVLEERGIEVALTDDARELERWQRSGAVDLVVSLEPALALEWDPRSDAGELAHWRVVAALEEEAGRPAALDAEERAAAAAGPRYVDWFVPGLLALSVMSTSIWAVGFAFVEARQKNLIKRFLVTPVSRSSFLFSFVLARLALLIFEVALLLAFAHWVLGVSIRGSLASLYAVAFTGGLVFAGIGVLLGSRSRTQEGAAGLINLTMMPMGLCSGVFFAYERFSEGLQPLIKILPLTAFVDAMRAVQLEGEGLASQWPEMLIQVVWGGAAFWIGLAVFRWK